MQKTSSSASKNKPSLVKRKSPPSILTRPKTMFVSQTEAKNKFLAHCRHVIDTKEFICVQDQKDEAFLTLTARPVKGSFVTVSAQFFKDNFARCSSLIRDGLSFRLTLRGSNQAIFARRHTAYRDPLDDVIEQWRERIADDALAAADTDADGNLIAQLAREFSAFVARQDKAQDDMRDLLKRLILDITRLSIGHKPFEEGQAPDQRYVEPRDGLRPQ